MTIVRHPVFFFNLLQSCFTSELQFHNHHLASTRIGPSAVIYQAANGSETETKPPHPVTLITCPTSPPQTSLPSTRTKPNQTKPCVY